MRGASSCSARKETPRNFGYPDLSLTERADYLAGYVVFVSQLIWVGKVSKIKLIDINSSISIVYACKIKRIKMVRRDALSDACVDFTCASAFLIFPCSRRLISDFLLLDSGTFFCVLCVLLRSNFRRYYRASLI
jgi:hypothetical protein